ncbi:MAG: hypothetical protein A3J58_00420 [Candidatus Sungbacteria bacterium RIFCSPHIGHO2_02_FULL_52_23]|uniref:Uncharacterized protein n=1 Tax=Candidatus Sungbacteria bacterium RIFCSPHIGHO2_02_FULL_52_23 TaxID=1802274 RepID=A0A1G2KSY2_9BACT|nr:MAG: hypothetical protein A3J58_00420 [Candidatus Sungbacteria bacterium RIFCSPHIGHO2_02_FULL_52_23]
MDFLLWIDTYWHASTMEHMKKKNVSVATKVDMENLADATAKGFVDVEKRLGDRIHAVDKKVDALNEKIDIGFADMRQEMQGGFRMVLAAIETVE